MRSPTNYPSQNKEVLNMEDNSNASSQRKLQYSTVTQPQKQLNQLNFVDNQNNRINTSTLNLDKTDVSNTFKNSFNISQTKQLSRSTYQYKLPSNDIVTNRYTITGDSRFIRSPEGIPQLNPYNIPIKDQYNKAEEEQVKKAAIAKPYKDISTQLLEPVNITYEPVQEKIMMEEGETVELNDPYLIDIIKKENNEINNFRKSQNSRTTQGLGDKSITWKKKQIKEPKKYDEEDDGVGLFFGMCVATRKKKDQDAEAQERKKELSS